MSYQCPFEGRYKAVADDIDGGRVTKLFCKGHVDDWMQRLPSYTRFVTPRRLSNEPPSSCTATWPLPAFAPIATEDT